MTSRRLITSPILLQSICAASAQAGPDSQKYDTSYQVYQGDDDRIRIESFYLRGSIDFTADTSFRFQYLRDSISGSSPTGALPGSNQPFLAEIDDLREGVLGALSHQFGDHRVELELSRSEEEDYLSEGLALSDTWDLNLKNTSISYGINLLSDSVAVVGLSDQDKTSADFFAGITQVYDKNTLLSAKLTLGYADGYLNDPYKSIQRDDSADFGLPPGFLINTYSENRPDSRFRQVLQLGATRYYDRGNGALDALLRFSQDDYGVSSQTIGLEWRQEIGERFEVTPFFRFYHQNAADFFANTLDCVNVPNPADFPDGSGPNYSADYRLSSLNTLSLGLRLRYQISEQFSANASYERYSMSASGGGSDTAPDQAYPDANIWTLGFRAEF